MVREFATSAPAERHHRASIPSDDLTVLELPLSRAERGWGVR
jgi:hypothetical protein